MSVRVMLRRIRTEIRDVIELVLVPGLAAILPWGICFWIFKRLARWSWLYHDASTRALMHATQRGWVANPREWGAERRLVTLIDHADFYLARTRGDGWMRQYLRVEGVWPAVDFPAVLCTFHWGAGMWGLRHAAVSGMRGHPLVAPLCRDNFAGRSVLYWYACQRTACVGRMVQSVPLDVSASLRPVLRALRANEQVMAAVDVPADQAHASISIPILNQRARVPTALLRLAVEQRVPVWVYVTGVNLKSGQRFLRLISMPFKENVEEMTQQVFSELDNIIQECPAAWHFWGEAERFFEPG